MNDASISSGGIAPPGLIAPNLTPFGPDLKVDIPLYVAHAKRLLDDGCVALAPFGTTGEGPSVGLAERIEVLQALVDAGVSGDRLIPGTGLASLTDTVELSRACLELGCGGVMVLPPYYFKGAPDDGLFAYFANFLESVGREDARICLYHIPQVAGVGIPTDVARRLREAFPRQIVAIKDSTGDWENTKSLLEIDGLTVYPGSEYSVVNAIEMGAVGCISALANVNAPTIAGVIASALDGNFVEARERLKRAAAFRDVVQGYAPINAQKRLLAMETGNEAWANVRPPLLPLSEEKGRELREALDALNPVPA